MAKHSQSISAPALSTARPLEEALTTVFLLIAALIVLCLRGQAESMLSRNEAIERAAMQQLLAPPPTQACPEKETDL